MATNPQSKPSASPTPRRPTASKVALVAATGSAKSDATISKSSSKKNQPKSEKTSTKVTTVVSIKMKKASFHMLETEQESLVALKHVLSDAVGKKVKKDDLLRVAVRLLLKQTQAKVKAELAAIAASSGE